MLGKITTKFFDEKYIDLEKLCKKKNSKRNIYSSSEKWKEFKQTLRLFSIFLVLNKGMKISNAANKIEYSRKTLGHWIFNFKKNGESGLVEKERKGRPKKISKSVIDKIKQNIYLNPGKYSTGKSIANLIKKEFDINISIRHCQRLKQNELK